MGGSYNRKYVNDGSGARDLGAPALVSNFRLDKYDVTVGRFRQFVKAWNNGNGWMPAAGSGKHTHLNGGKGLTNCAAAGTYETGWVAADDSNIAPTPQNLACGSVNGTNPTWTATAGANEMLPITCVNWYEAYAFCIWDGGFLPTEAEWEYAAAGGSQQLAFPWGSTMPGTESQYAIYGCYYPSGTGTCTTSNLAPVGTAILGAGRWGQLDLVGEVWQWELDWANPYVSPCIDCAYLTQGGTLNRMVWGDYFADPSPATPASVLATLTPPGSPPDQLADAQPRNGNAGFRCARAQ